MKRKILFLDKIDPYIRYTHLFEVEKGFSLSRRSAYDYRLMYIYDGSGYMTLDNVKYDVSKGLLLMWRPGVAYDIHPAADSSLSIIGINFDFTQENSGTTYSIPPEDVEVFNADKITEIIEFSDVDEFNSSIILRNMQYLENLLLDIVNEFSVRKRFYIHKMRGLFLSLLGDIARHITSTYTDGEGTNHKVDLILKYIRENYNKPITNEEIGEYFKFHPVYINRLLVKYTGTSLHQYLINYRISMAINLLQNSGKSITEVAFEVGFNDTNYFSKYFKKTVGLSPKKYISASRINFGTVLR